MSRKPPQKPKKPATVMIREGCSVLIGIPVMAILLSLALNAPATDSQGEVEQLRQQVEDLKAELAAVQRMVGHRPGWTERVRSKKEEPPPDGQYCEVYWLFGTK